VTCIAENITFRFRCRYLFYRNPMSDYLTFDGEKHLYHLCEASESYPGAYQTEDITLHILCILLFLIGCLPALLSLPLLIGLDIRQAGYQKSGRITSSAHKFQIKS
jgi:hypothetical protein